ncbi:MAG: TrkH family potassium uptake protein [Gammaproteobacteria bacterium]
MQILVIQKIIGALLILFSATMILPMIVSMIYQDQHLVIFIQSLAIPLILGSLLYYPQRNNNHDLKLRDGFIIVALFWFTLSFFGALPFIFSESLNISFTDSVFESVSGITTTGATVLTQINELPYSILFYRNQLQWFGGLGIIVLAVAILPLLGVGGMQLYKAETPGGFKENKIAPRITHTAKALWYIYLTITIACTLAYFFAGMSFFDAICHAFSTVSIGGFSTYDESFAHFNSSTIEIIAIVFMLIAGINFSLHFLAWNRRSLRYYFEDSEVKGYLYFLGFACLLVSLSLGFTFGAENLHQNVINGIFQTVSFATTTGFSVTEIVTWPDFLPMLLIILSFIGGCAGSTAGGMKVVRWLLVLKQGSREIKRLVHPHAQYSVKLGKKVIDNKIIEAVWGFFSVYSIAFFVLIFLVMLSGVDYTTSFSMIAATLNNLGPGLGDVINNYESVNDFNKWICVISMILGRLEIFTLLVLISPTFWKA